MMIPCTSSLYTHALLVPVPQEYDTPHPLHSQHEPGKHKRNTHFESQWTFPFCLNFRRDVSQTLQLHLHGGYACFWLVLILSDQSQLARTEHPYCSTLQRPDVVCSREVKETRGRGKDTSALELTKNFYSIIQNYFFPFHSVFLGKKSRLFGYKKFQENPVEKWMGHCFSCRSGEKFTGATDHLER